VLKFGYVLQTESIVDCWTGYGLKNSAYENYLLYVKAVKM